jgi:prepilin-type N-terminal cleavage/methylation domain-containing protein
MSSFLRRTRGRLVRGREDRGYSLVELIVALALSALIMSVVPSLFQTVTTASTSAQGTAIGSEQADLAIQNLDRQVASASQVCLPTQVTTAQTATGGWALRIEQVEASGVPQWEQWVVDPASGVMQEESFTPGGAGNGWETVARTIYNTTIPPFQEPTAAPGSPQEVVVDLQVSERPGRLTQTLEIKSAISAFSTPYSPALPTECAASTTTPTS